MAAKQTIEILLVQEATHYRTEDYFGHDQLKGKIGQGVTVEARKQLVDWMYRCCDLCHYSKETAERAQTLFDRFMVTSEGSNFLQSCHSFTLAAMTAFWTTAKAFESFPMAVADIVKWLAKGTYSSEDLIVTETKMLDSLEWRVNCPTTLDFIREAIDAFPETLVDEASKSVLFGRAKLQVECAVREYDTIHIEKSLLAFAAVSNALDIFYIPLDIGAILRTSISFSYDLKHLESWSLLKRELLLLVFSTSNPGFKSLIGTVPSSAYSDDYAGDSEIECYPSSSRPALKLSTTSRRSARTYVWNPLCRLISKAVKM